MLSSKLNLKSKPKDVQNEKRGNFWEEVTMHNHDNVKLKKNRNKAVFLILGQNSQVRLEANINFTLLKWLKPINLFLQKLNFYILYKQLRKNALKKQFKFFRISPLTSKTKSHEKAAEFL